MAAVDPSESPKRQKSPAEEVETSGEKAEAAESGCSLNEKDETICDETGESPGDKQKPNVGNEGACNASHSEVSVGSGAGADKKTCKSPGNLTSAEKMAEAPDGEQRAFDWSETEDDAEGTKTQEENTKCGMLTLLMYFIVSFSLQASLLCSSHRYFNTLSTMLTLVTITK